MPLSPYAKDDASGKGMDMDAWVKEFRRIDPNNNFSDFKVTVVHSVAEGDLVVQHTRNTGTMTGEFRGMKPTGKSATWDIVHIVRFQDGKAVEHWAIADNLAMLQQLGLAPAAPSARAA